MGRSEWRGWAAVCLEGLLLDGERKPLEPIAERTPRADVQELLQLVGQSPWAVDEIQQRLARRIIYLLSDAQVRIALYNREKVAYYQPSRTLKNS
jgi:SRSO17 transposase